MRGGWLGGLDDETAVFLVFFKTKLKFLLYVKTPRINSSMPFYNEFRWMIFLEMTFLYHVMYRYMTIKLEMLGERETSDMHFLKVTFSFSINTVQEGELEVEADSREATATPATVRTQHYLWLYYCLSVFSLFMQLLVLSLMEILHQIIIIRPVIKWCRLMPDGAK